MRSDGAMAHRAALLAVVLVLGSCADDAAAPPAPGAATAPCAGSDTQMDLPYVDGGDPQQRLDLYYPPGADCDAVPVVVWVHGGGWRVGDKANGMEDKVRQWTDAGWAVASVNYRLTDAQAPVDDRIVAPSHNEDVAAALSWLAKEAPARGIDPERMAVVGHSAGAAIAGRDRRRPCLPGAPPPATFRAGDERGQLVMDQERHTCTWMGEPVTLTVTEFLILHSLAQRPGVVKSRDALMDAAYDEQVYVDDRTIDSHIKRLRKKFKVVDDDFDMIETLYGVGYRFRET